jgi:3-hydroxyisobutyrate dehydrogenase
MTTIGFIGLGNMGGPMALNLVKAGYQVTGFDPQAKAADLARAGGVVICDDANHAARAADIVITMLPAGGHVRAVYLGDQGLIHQAKAGALFIDCSTIDVTSARDVAMAAEQHGHLMLDAPVSGGVGGAGAGTLTFMVGGAADAFARARPVLDAMGKNIIHAGGAGNGQAAKICNNMMLGIQMISVAEAFNLAASLGLEAQTLFDISSKASGQCWSLTTYCPVPGPVPTSPANRDYQPGFTTAMMLKDLKLAQEAAKAASTATPLGAQAAQLFGLYAAQGGEAKDFSGIIRYLADLE